MSCACINIFRPEKLDESFRQILWQYQQFVMEDTTWFSIELEWHMDPKYTEFEKEQLTKVFGKYPEQEINIFGETDRIFVVACELIRHFGGLLRVNLSGGRRKIKSYPGIKIPVYQLRYEHQSRHDPDYWLVDHIFLKQYFTWINPDYFEKFNLSRFLPKA